MNPFILLVTALLFTTIKTTASTKDTSETEKRYSRSKLIDDVHFLTSTISKVHPNMYHSVSKKRYQKIIDSVNNALCDNMTAKESWPVMVRLVGALNEGHSTLNYPENVIDQMKADGSMLFPLLLQGFDGTHLIVQNDFSQENKLNPGDKITGINGITAVQLIDSLSRHIGGLRSFRAINICRDIISYINMYNIKGPYDINYIRDDIPGNVTVNSISWSDFKNRRMTQTKNTPKDLGPVDFSFDYLDQDRAYLNLNTFSVKPQSFNNFIDSCFTLLKTKPAKMLIIDLRRNGGGNSILAERLLSYITDRPFRMTAGVNWKVSQEYKNYLNDKLNREAIKRMSYYFDADNGSIIKTNNVKTKYPTENTLRYYGKVIVLIGPRTFSSANMLANSIQDYKLATLVGEPSGEPANDYGELLFLRLPNTGLSFSTSTKQFIRANGNEKDLHPVLPQYKIIDNPSTQVDEVLEYAKSLW